MKISMLSALSVWGCDHCDLLSIKVLRARLAFFKSSWGSRVDLAEAREMDSPLSLTLSPDHEALASVSQARFGVSSECADETSSLASGEEKVPPQCAPLVMKKLMRSYSRWLLGQSIDYI